jgi:phosphatidylinositol glycan class P protein
MESVYAFVGWIGSILVYIVFLVWAFAPESLMHGIGITYYPSRYYAVALPAYIMVTMVVVGVFYVGINMFHTFEPEDLRTVEDRYTRTAPSQYLKFKNKGASLPDIGDLDPCYVSSLLNSSSSLTSPPMTALRKAKSHKKKPQRRYTQEIL